MEDTKLELPRKAKTKRVKKAYGNFMGQDEKK